MRRATGSPPSVEPLRPAVRPPEPSRFWVRYTPRGWPPMAVVWTDLAAGGLGAAPPPRGPHSAQLALPPMTKAPLDDVLYLPPVPAALEGERRALARRRMAGGTPVLVQVPLGGEDLDPALRLAESGATVVYDPLPALAAGGLENLRRTLSGAPGGGGSVAPGAAAVWPLVPGLADDAGEVERACDLLAAAGLATVQPLRLQLTPVDRRRLAEVGGPAAFHALFHRPPPEERTFARAAAARGLAPFLSRPLAPGSGPADAARDNRRLAGLLALAGELWLRLGRAEAQGQAFFRAARWIDETTYGVAALAREGNLTVVAALDDASRALIAAAAAAGPGGRAVVSALPPPLDELMAAYVAADGGKGER